MSGNRHTDWLRQAQNDLQSAGHLHAGGFNAQACYIAQQAGLKALKALCFARGFDIVRTHSLFQLVRDLGENGEVEACARELDLFYISGRYPDAFPAGAPFELISTEQAGRAMDAARRVLAFVAERLVAS
ncbi:MAG TPA: HEPN domain-containing protein [Gammaproteobacteria bacterium]